MTTENAGFDARAKSWDDDPMKVERAETVAAAIAALARWSPGMRGIEFGCGTGLLGFALRERFDRMVLADTSVGMLDVLRQKIETLGAAEACSMYPLLLDETLSSLANERFDMIFSLMTLHHVPDTDGVLARFAQSLGQGGQICIADLDAEDGSFHDHDTSVHPGFDRVALSRQASAAGFTDIRFSSVFQIAKGSPERKYPVFLMIAEKA